MVEKNFCWRCQALITGFSNLRRGLEPLVGSSEPVPLVQESLQVVSAIGDFSFEEFTDKHLFKFVLLTGEEVGEPSHPRPEQVRGEGVELIIVDDFLEPALAALRRPSEKSFQEPPLTARG